MKTFSVNRKILYAITTILFAICISGFSLVSAEADSSVKVENLSVNNVYNTLIWDEVEGADSYSYRVNGGEWRFAIKNSVDITPYILEAASAAVETTESAASIDFSVRADIDGTFSEETTYTYTFENYNDVPVVTKIEEYVGGSESPEGLLSPEYRDLRVNGFAGHNELLHSKISIAGKRGRLMFGFRHRPLDGVYDDWFNHMDVSIFNNQELRATSLNYEGWSGKPSVVLNPLAADKIYDVFVGSVDVKNFAGEKIAERVIGIVSYTDENGNVEIMGQDFYDYTEYAEASDYSKNGYIYADADLNVKVFPAGEDKDDNFIKNLKVDPLYNELKWDEVPGADSYEYSINGGAWENTLSASVDVRTVLVDAAAQSAGDTAEALFTVRALNGTEVLGQTSYLYTFSEYTENIDIVNIEDYMPELAEGSYILGEQGKGPHYPLQGVSGVNMLMHSKVRFNIASGGRFFVAFRSQADMWGQNYAVNFQIWPASVQFWVRYDLPTTTLPETVNQDKALPGGDIIYDLYVGSVEVFNLSGEKIAERIIGTLNYINENGQLETVFHATYDYTDFKDKTFSSVMDFYAQQKIEIFAVNSFEETYRVDVVQGSELLESFDINFGGYYDFTAIQPILEPGYKFIGWAIEEDNDNFIPISEKGMWMTFCENQVNVVPQFEELEYTITYEGVENATNLNPSTVTVNDAIELKDLTALPAGKLFFGWFEDAAFTQKVTEIKDCTGNKTLYAKVADGFTVSTDINGVIDKIAIESGETYTLTAPANTEEKTFVGWLVKNEDEFIPYDASTVVVDKNYEFKADFVYTEFDIEYILDDGVQNPLNPDTFTVEGVILRAATKEGYFFDGWYFDSAFTQKAEELNTAGNKTVYAKYMKDETPSSITLYCSDEETVITPIPIPDGASVSIKLFKDSQELNLSAGNKYVFEEAGEYNVVYQITLYEGTVIEREVPVMIKEIPVITINGTYRESYNVGENITIFEGLLDSDDFSVNVKVERNGTPVSVTGNTLVLEEGVYKITYFTASKDIQEVSVTFSVEKIEDGGETNPEQDPDPAQTSCEGCSGTVSSELWLVSFIIIAVVFIVLVKKRNAE